LAASQGHGTVSGGGVGDGGGDGAGAVPPNEWVNRVL